MAERARTIVTTSWDDGHPLDLRLAELLSDYGVRGTFYFAPRSREREVLELADLRRLAGQFEIGGHTLTHPDLRALDQRNLDDEVAGGKRAVEDAIGRPVEMFCYPKGRCNERVRLAVEEAGFIGARTTQLFRFDVPDPFRMPTTLTVKSAGMAYWLPRAVLSLSGRGLRLLADVDLRIAWLRLARGLFRHAFEHGGVYHLRGHSWEIEQHAMWNDLEEVLKVITQQEGVAYVTNGELVRMMQAEAG